MKNALLPGPPERPGLPPPRHRPRWNVVVTLKEGDFREALRRLRAYGSVRRTAYLNVVALRVDDPRAFLDDLHKSTDASAWIRSVRPALQTFVFRDPTEFRRKAIDVVRAWAPSLPGRTFHIRMHRRGFRGRLRPIDEERRLGQAVLDDLDRRGRRPAVSFEDPDGVFDVESIDGQAGVSLWSREDLRRYPLLKVD